MNTGIKKLFSVVLIVSLVACSGNNELANKKAALEKLKNKLSSLSNEISTLEKEIEKLDTATKKDDVATLVALSTIKAEDFKHYIDLQGKIDAENISYISPRLGPGQVKALYIKKGDEVKKGQLLLKLDDAIIMQSINAAKQSLESAKTQLAFAKDIYNRQNNLWKQGIGTEVQLISAKTNVETIEKQLRAGEENIKTIQEQAKATNIYSDVDGIADEVNVRVGETFSGIGAMGAQIKIVNTSALKVITDVPENYGNKVKPGSKVLVIVSELNKIFTTTIYVSGKVINPNNRSFIAEAKLPADAVLRPNQNAQVKIEDYAVKNAITVPVNIVNTDEKGKYVFVAVQEGNKLVAHKKAIVIGEMYNQFIEVKSGLTVGDKIITEGYQDIYDGQSLKIQ